ncbi:MAG: primosomal protein N', partial [Candidatus Sulfobium sp.]
PEEDISDITGTLSEKRYHTFLVHAPSSTYEYSLVRALLGTGLRNILVILPEISRANTLAGALADRFRDRLCVLHAGITGGRRSEYIRRILAGTHDVVVGTGLALFAPMPNISVIMVLREHGSSYKREEGIRFNIRDAAVMRGYMERCKVMLTSISPSVDSYFNALSGKYSFIRPRMRAERPKIRTVDMKFEKKASPGISKTALDISRSRLSLGKRVMFVINRRGHSTLFLCEDCGHTERCPSCDIPLVLHKKEKVLKCHYCGVSRDIPGKCEKCGGHRLRLAGYGTQKVQEEIEVLLGAEALRFDSDEVKKRSEVAEILRSISKDSTKVVVGTRMMTKRLEIEKFGLAVVLNIDASLNIPDFRSSEKTYMELASIGELLGPGGQMVIQTRFPGTPVFRYLREGDYLSFVREELAVRKNMHYPPYSRLLQITFSGGVDVPRAEELVLRAGKNVEVLGPVIDKDRKGEERVTFLLKSGDKRLLRAAAKKITGITRNVRGPKVVIDVDPV